MAQMRLNKFLAHAGVASRRAADELITTGNVAVNGKTQSVLGTMIDADQDEVTVDGKRVRTEKPIIYAIYKPRGVTSTVADVHASQKIVDLLPKGKRIYPVGRLDKESEGLLLVTNDGELANQLMHPSFEHEKEYEVVLHGRGDFIEQIPNVKEINGSKIEPLKITSKTQLGGDEWQVNMILKEGKKREIREVAKKVGLRVTRLKRIRIGKLTLGNLAAGKWKIVTETDIL